MANDINQLVHTALEDLKALDITDLDVSKLTDVTDMLVIATGTSSRHVKAMASNIIADAKKEGTPPIGFEGLDAGEWVLIDFGDTVVHVMLKATRDLYELEKLWSQEPAGRQDQA